MPDCSEKKTWPVGVSTCRKPPLRSRASAWGVFKVHERAENEEDSISGHCNPVRGPQVLSVLADTLETTHTAWCSAPKCAWATTLPTYYIIIHSRPFIETMEAKSVAVSPVLSVMLSHYLLLLHLLQLTQFFLNFLHLPSDSKDHFDRQRLFAPLLLRTNILFLPSLNYSVCSNPAARNG